MTKTAHTYAAERELRHWIDTYHLLTPDQKRYARRYAIPHLMATPGLVL